MVKASHQSKKTHIGCKPQSVYSFPMSDEVDCILQNETPTGMFVATLVARAKNSKGTLILYFRANGRCFSLPVRSQHAFAPRYGGPSFASAPLNQKYILAVRRIRTGAFCLEYAMPHAESIVTGAAEKNP